MYEGMISRFKSYQDDFEKKSLELHKELDQIHQNFIENIKNFIANGTEEGLTGVQFVKLNERKEGIKDLFVKLNDIDWLFVIRNDIINSKEGSTFFENRIYCYLLDDVPGYPFYIIHLLARTQFDLYKISLWTQDGLEEVLHNTLPVNQIGDDLVKQLIEQIYLFGITWNNSLLREETKGTLGFPGIRA